jgi:hypothetical protein
MAEGYLDLMRREGNVRIKVLGKAKEDMRN